MSEHTPGPWEIIKTQYKREVRTEIVRRGLSEPVARVYHKGTCNGYHYTMPQDANAALIMAAPDLLAVSIDAMRHLRKLQKEGHPVDGAVILALADAIGKARRV